ncbi:hypothetical protein FGO68_gene9411 [Halteria grandinella]|uniref:Uncharacterized protein n=1 Tax=Halteria grandinella TaxID=5974 RepID=A0A8J8SXG5_HALGN|nr:hypothetical protein FGO68_gene9411 [Halteria grandinella]
MKRLSSSLILLSSSIIIGLANMSSYPGTLKSLCTGFAISESESDDEYPPSKLPRIGFFTSAIVMIGLGYSTGFQIGCGLAKGSPVWSCFLRATGRKRRGGALPVMGKGALSSILDGSSWIIAYQTGGFCILSKPRAFLMSELTFWKWPAGCVGYISSCSYFLGHYCFLASSFFISLKLAPPWDGSRGSLKSCSSFCCFLNYYFTGFATSTGFTISGPTEGMGLGPSYFLLYSTAPDETTSAPVSVQPTQCCPFIYGYGRNFGSWNT